MFAGLSVDLGARSQHQLDFVSQAGAFNEADAADGPSQRVCLVPRVATELVRQLSCSCRLGSGLENKKSSEGMILQTLPDAGQVGLQLTISFSSFVDASDLGHHPSQPSRPATSPARFAGSN